MRAALLGDVVASRSWGRRDELQTIMESALGEVNRSTDPVQPLTMTVGDEFQGLFVDVAASVDAVLRIQMHVGPEADFRTGIGWGELTLQSEGSPLRQDGPCWWRAREAIDEVRRLQHSNSAPRSTRTRVISGEGADSLWNGFLSVRDHIVSTWDEVDMRLAEMAMNGEQQVEMASVVGLAQSSVSRRLQNHGILAVVGEVVG